MPPFFIASTQRMKFRLSPQGPHCKADCGGIHSGPHTMRISHTFPLLLLLSATSLTLAAGAQAAEEIYKQVDKHGNVTYSNKPLKGGKKVDLPPLSTFPEPKAPPPQAPAQPAPKADIAQRKQVLQEAIAKEEKALAAAKTAAKEGAEMPDVYRHTKTVMGKNGKPVTITETRRNVAAYEEKMKKLNAEVALHEKNLEKLRAELASLDTKP